MQNNVNFEELISKYLFQQLTANEKDLLDKWLDEDPLNKLLFDKLTNEKYITSALRRMEEYDEKKGWSMLKTTISFSEESSNKKKIVWWAVAASFLLLSSITYYFLQNKSSASLTGQTTVRAIENIKAPDKNIATITLSDGTILSLDSLNENTPLIQQTVKLVKHDDGHISYAGSTLKQENNKVVNPKGSRVIQIELSDGSRIWLNAGSSITYPLTFIGEERIVTVEGEVYFEVAKDIAHPFIVKKDEVEVKVLGTSFNVNAYQDEENIKVTLLSGKVSLKNGIDQAVLLPGEQGVVNASIKINREVNMEAVMAWKNGLFYFNQANLKTLVKQIEKWYDVEMEIAPGVSNRVFGGKIKRDASLVNVLKIMEESNIHYTVTNSKITIVP